MTKFWPSVTRLEVIQYTNSPAGKLRRNIVKPIGRRRISQRCCGSMFLAVISVAASIVTAEVIGKRDVESATERFWNHRMPPAWRGGYGGAPVLPPRLKPPNWRIT